MKSMRAFILSSPSEEHKVGDLVFSSALGLGWIEAISSDPLQLNLVDYPYKVSWSSRQGLFLYDDRDIQEFKHHL